MSRARSEQGFALIASIMILSVIAAIAVALLLLTNSGQKAALREQASETAFNVAEAALQAQIGQLSRAWPAKESEAYPSRCTSSTTTESNACPSAASLNAGYPNVSPVPCAANAPSDAWGSALTNEWTTYVRDDAGEPASALFNSSSESAQPAWDKNGDGSMWVRAVGVVQCRVIVLVTLVSRNTVALNFPHHAITGNWFEDTNEGNKVIVDTQGESAQPGEVSMRCTPPHNEPCEKFRKGQVSPETTNSPASPAETLSQKQLEALKQEAQAAGTYYATGSCPSAPPAGAPVYCRRPV
jgi:Tfp pilus assembly protein PilX